MSLFAAANEPGPQVKGPDGEWMDVPCGFSPFIIHIGDMLPELGVI